MKFKFLLTYILGILGNLYGWKCPLEYNGDHCDGIDIIEIIFTNSAYGEVYGKHSLLTNVP
jgi:hypothetical protein